MKEVREATKLLPDSITVAGRTFYPTQNTTFEQDIYLMSLMTETGIDKIAATVTEEMKLNQVAQKVIAAAYNSGKLFLILAAGMLEAGKKWNKPESEALAQWLADLDQPEDKAKLHGLIATAVLGFFLIAVGSSKTSKSFGSPDEIVVKPEPSTSELPSTSESSLEGGLGLAPTAYQAEAPTISESGTTSSES